MTLRIAKPAAAALVLLVVSGGFAVCSFAGCGSAFREEAADGSTRDGAADGASNIDADSSSSGDGSKDGTPTSDGALSEGGSPRNDGGATFPCGKDKTCDLIREFCTQFYSAGDPMNATFDCVPYASCQATAGESCSCARCSCDVAFEEKKHSGSTCTQDLTSKPACTVQCVLPLDSGLP
jgi:hypothetical protein